MSTEGLTPVLIDQYGGLCTLIDRSDLPIGLSPDCGDVEFFPGGVRSRNGFASHLTAPSTVTGMLPFVSTAGVRKLLVLMTNGTIQVEYPETTLSGVQFSDVAATTTALGAGLYMRGTQMFGRAYFALSDGKNGVSGPFQYDGNRISAVGQNGPAINFLLGEPVAGNVAAGRHAVTVVYETESGYVTGVQGSGSILSSGALNIRIYNLTPGPGTVTKRIFFVTPANSVSFFTLPQFVLNDNTSTEISVDFTDSELLSGTSLEDYVDNTPLSPMLGVEKYGARMVYWGGFNSLRPFLDANATTPTLPTQVGYRSLDFDGSESVIPNPWLATVAGGTIVAATGAPLLVYRITGDGATADRGSIYQSNNNIAYSNTFYIQPQKTYGIRVRARRNSTAAAGTLSIVARYKTAIPGSEITYASFTKAVTALTTEWQILSDETGTVNTAGSGPFIDMTLKISGTLTLNGEVDVDWVEVYDTTEKDAPSFLWITPPNDPETVRPATDLVAVSENDGQAIRDVFELRGNLYICKEHSLYVTTDNGDEPYAWTVDQVSDTVGTPSAHGVGLGDGWAIIASRNGLYHFTGGAPEKLSQEIQSVWETLDWANGHKLWVAVDTAAQKIFVGMPLAGETAPDDSVVLVLDYVEGFGDPISGGGRGRKWAVWYISFLTGTMVERDALTSTFMGAYSTRIAKQTTGLTADWKGAFTSYYETAPIGTEIGRSLFDRVVIRIRGGGNLLTSKRTPGGTLTSLTTKTLSATPDDDVEIRMHDNQTQIGFRVGTSGATDYWSMRKLGVFIRPSEYSYLRKT